MTPMVLYLCQHGDALAKDVDPDRPLSERGTADVGAVGGALARRVAIHSIVHSGKTRARRTAELLHDTLAPAASIEEASGLGPNDPVENVAGWLDSLDSNLLLVGHMPFVGRLASHLLATGRDVLDFEPGAVAALSRDTEGSWTLSWMLTPALVTN